MRVCLGVEKAGLVAQLSAWYGELGISIVALRGYSSQTLVDEVRLSALDVMLYAGDYDPSGLRH